VVIIYHPNGKQAAAHYNSLERVEPENDNTDDPQDTDTTLVSTISLHHE